MSNPIISASDGPKLILADGKVVQPIVSAYSGDEMMALGYDQGAALFGREVDHPEVSVAFVDDPEAKAITSVSEALEDFGFGDNLLRGPPGATGVVVNDRTGVEIDAETDDDGIIRNSRGQCFSSGAYSIKMEDFDD